MSGNLEALVSSLAMHASLELAMTGWIRSTAIILGPPAIAAVYLESDTECVSEEAVKKAKELARKAQGIVYVTLAMFAEDHEKALLVMGYTPKERVHMAVPLQVVEQDGKKVYAPNVEGAKLGLAHGADWMDPWADDRKPLEAAH
jgi:hypothetical protein